jgi:hypothetical protein
LPVFEAAAGESGIGALLMPEVRDWIDKHRCCQHYKFLIHSIISSFKVYKGCEISTL